MEKSEAAAYLAGAKQVEGAEASAPTNLHVISGEVVEKSENGKVKVDLGGLVFNGDDEQSVEIATIGGLEVGDTATILLSGQEHRGMTPLGVGGVGTVDRIVERVSSIEADYIKTEVLEAERARIDELETTSLTADSAVIQELQVGKEFVDDLTAKNITVDRLEANSAYIKNLELQGITTDEISAATGYIDDLTAKSITTDKIQAASGYIDDLTASNITATNIAADHATIGQLDSNYAHITNGVIDNAKIGHADVNGLSANYATVSNLTAATGRISDLEATRVTTADLEANYITADTIESNYVKTDMSNTDVAWIQNGTIKDGAITNAMINSLSANKLTAGTINGETINVTNINANNITAGTINGQRIGEGSLSLDKLSEDVYTEQEVDNKLATMQAEIDGAIETWTGTEVPTLNNSPASNWTTAASRDTHVGDVYFVVNSQSEQNGYNYRFTKSGSTYSWQLIKDSDVTNALSRLSTAEGKITTFDSDISTLKTDTGTLKTKTESLETRMSDAEDDILDKVDTTTFNELSSTVDENSASITTFSTVFSNNGLTETTNITSTVNTVSQTATGNSSKLSQLTTTLGTNADGTTKEGDIVHRTSAVEQDLNGFKTTVSNTYATKTALGGVETTANNANGKSVAYSATSSTGASTAAKVASCTNFPTLVAGTTVTVRFSAANTSTGAITLNVNSTGAKTIYVNGSATSSTNQLLWSTNANITFTYDGTYWRVVSEPRTWYGSCSTGASTAAKVSTINEVVICKGTSVTLNMTDENTNASATLNITSTGAKNIYYGTTTTRPTTENGYGWTSASTVTLVFDGAYWRIGDTSALKGLATVNSTVSQHATLIEQNSEAIAAKANASDVYTTTQVDGLITTEVNNRNAAIEASADSITTSVSNTYATKTALQTTDGNISSLTTRVSTAETNIQQNSESIRISAKKAETIDGNMLYDVDASSLTKVYGPANRYFSDGGNSSFMVCDIRAISDAPAAGIEYMAHWSVSGSTANKQRGLCFYSGNYIQFIAGQQYTLSCWVRCTSGKFLFLHNAYANAFPSSSGARTIDSAEDSGWQFVTTTVTAATTKVDRVYFMARTLSDSLAFECDMCGFKMTVAAYATQAELKIANDAISSKVSTTDYNGNAIASMINQDATTVQIAASKVQIDGTAVFNAIKPSADAAYDANGAAATVQTNLDNLQVGGRNLLKASDAVHTPTTYNAYDLYLTEPIEDGVPYSLQLWDVDVSHTGKTAETLGVNVYYCGSSVSFGGWMGTNYFTDGHADYLKLEFTAYTSGATVSSGGSVDPSPTDALAHASVVNATKKFIRLYNSFPTANGTRNLTVGKWKLEKGNKATDWSPAPEDVTADVLASGLEYIEGTQTAATNLWTGVTKETALVAGKSIAYKLPYAGTSAAATLNLTLAGGGTTGAKAVKMVYSTTNNTGALSNVTTHWPVNSIIQMTYDGTQWVISNYNTNVDDKNARNVRFYNTIVAGEALKAASIIGMHADGKFYQVKEHATFLLSAPLLWLTTAKAADATNADAIYTHAYDVNLGTYYTSFANTTNNCTVYLVGTVNGNTFSTYGSSSAQYLTVTEPTTEDGRFYIPLGRLSNSSTGKDYFNYVVDYPVSLYAYIDGKFRQVTPTEIVASHRIYWRSAASTKPSAPTAWIEEATQNTYDAWTTKIPPLSSDKNSATATKYLYLYTCEQRKRLDGTIQCTDVQLDENTTVIDGGNIITSTITANQLSANAVTADKIAADALTLGKFTAEDKLLVDNSNVQVGGRNLILNTGEAKTSAASASSSSYTSNYTLSDYGHSIMNNTDDEWYCSFDYEVSGNSESNVNVYFQFRGAATTVDITPKISGNASGHYGESFKLTSAQASSTSNKCRFRMQRATDGATLTISNLKLEKGNKATDWTPAPEDVDSNILSTSREINNQIDQINGGITNLEDDVKDHESRLSTTEGDLEHLRGDLDNLTATTQWLSFNTTDGLVIGDNNNFYTRQLGSVMTFNQVTNGNTVELMSLSGTDGIAGPKVTVSEQINTPLLTSDTWSITLSGDMFSINYIGS